MFSLKNKNALIIGVANEFSLAWGVAQSLHKAGAKLAITYLNEKAEKFVRPLANSIDTDIILPFDVTNQQQEDDLFYLIEQKWGKLDILIHSIAYAPLKDLHGRAIETTSDGFKSAMDISVHSFMRAARRCEPLMKSGGACITMSYYGAEKVISTYNIMGPVKAALEATTRQLAYELGHNNISVNALSPGPILTRAASGIDNFDELIYTTQDKIPMPRLATIEDVGAAAVFLASDEARSITGTILPIDAGFHIMG